MWEVPEINSTGLKQFVALWFSVISSIFAAPLLVVGVEFYFSTGLHIGAEKMWTGLAVPAVSGVREPVVGARSFPCFLSLICIDPHISPYTQHGKSLEAKEG